VKIAQEKSHKQGNQWWYVQQLIANLDAGSDAPGTLKHLLTLVHRHTNSKLGYAWASQQTIAREMSCSVPTVERAFAKAKRMGVLAIRRVRTGKNPKDQHNEFWLLIPRLKELQLPHQHPSPVMADADEHPSSMMADDDRTPIKNDPSSHHFQSEQPSKTSRTPITSDGIGLDLKQVESNSGREHVRGEGSLFSPAPGVSPEIESQIQELLRRTISLLRSYDMRIEKPRLDIQFDFFRKDANSLGVSWTEIQKLWKQVLQAVFPPEPAPPPQAQQPEPEPEWHIDRNQIQNLRRHARERGWDAEILRTYVRQHYGLSCLAHLSFTQYNAMMDLLHSLSKTR
jgi:hypothetical protein